MVTQSAHKGMFATRLETQIDLEKPAGHDIWRAAPRWTQPLRTGPRTRRGRHRSSLNRLKKGLLPDGMERELLARGEDPKEFLRMHRDLIGWLWPQDARGRQIVAELAKAWWEKHRQVLSWKGPGIRGCRQIDAHIEALLQCLFLSESCLNRKAGYRWDSAFGECSQGDRHLRRLIEARVPALGGRPPGRAIRHQHDPLRDLDLSQLLKIISVMYPRLKEAAERPE